MEICSTKSSTEYGEHKLLKSEGLLISDAQAQNLGVELVAAIVKANQQAVPLERHSEPHDRALDQPGSAPTDRLASAAGVASSENCQNGEGSIDGSDTFNSGTVLLSFNHG